MAIIDQTNIDIQELLNRIKRERSEAAKRGDHSQYHSLLAVENSLLWQALAGAKSNGQGRNDYERDSAI